MGTKRSDEYREVYSTVTGPICPGCGRAENACSCPDDKRKEVKGDGNVKVRRETKGRAGKTVTTIAGLAMNEDQLKALLSDFQRVCGCGGAVKDGVLEIQGDHCDLILAQLGKRGIRAKRAGG